ncbi:hypothetical protein LFM56_17665 [Cellulomonas iranensis]|uniref:hypothetical protein n=1 Tax=Cellulomonas iranensis TaxID=76862 RepID=UPI001CF59801|nr:hypothetical protein [Cellulomonas iranensis]UCN14656.1 hypothetical protein LFM56_17665 [Cellulomonas iranensis]
MSTPAAPATPGPARRAPWWPWAVAVVVLVGVVVALLLTRGDGDDAAAPTTSPTPATTTPTTATSPSATPAASPTATAGCAPTGDGPPAGADVREVVDVDGDGRPDQAWLTGGADRRIGITTASGATFSAAIDSASPVPASAVVQRVQADAIPVVLVDLGREARLWSVVDCGLVAPTNAQGQAYTFDRGFAGEGTGVGCTQDGGALRLAGLDAVSADGGTFTVTRTWVDLGDGGRTARNGAAEQVATGAAADDPVVTTAQQVSCGDLLAGRDGPVEPAS